MNETYWTERYQNSNTPWDMKSVSPPLSGFLQGLYHTGQSILIPGAGSGYEAEWLWKQGFKNTWVADISDKPLRSLKERCPDFPDQQMLHIDFFEIRQSFDLVVEQTFFCALPPEWRPRYVAKMAEIIRPGGHLFGLLFNFPLTSEGPPYGGSVKEYLELFEPHFSIYKMERCYNSIKPRAGKEIFIHLIKP